nr:proline-rich protein 36-like [Nyctereutes procyonoides]
MATRGPTAGLRLHSPPGSPPRTRRRARRQWQLMEFSRNFVEEAKKHRGLGRCRHFFWLAVVFDAVGAALLFTGVFVDLFFYDLLLYLGSIVIFFSLLWWVFWYTGNIELTAEEAAKSPAAVRSSSSPADALGRRISITVCNVSSTLRRMRRRCGPRAVLQSVTLSGPLQSRLEEEHRGKDEPAGGQEGGDAQDPCREDLGRKPEAAGGAERVRTPGPEAAPPGRGKGSLFIRLVPPGFPPSLPDQSQSAAVVSSRSLPVVPSASARRPPALRVSRSQLAVTPASAGQPAPPGPSESPPAVPLSPMSPSTGVASQSRPAVSVASQVHPLVPVPAQRNLPVLLASQSHPQVSPALSHLQAPGGQSQLGNLPPASQTPSPGAQASQGEALATPVSLIQLPSSQSSQTQPVELQVSHAVPDSKTLCLTPQTNETISCVQGIAPSQSEPVQELQKKPVAQAFETPPPPAGQELKQEFPATASSPPESGPPAPQAQQSLSQESSTPAPASEKKSQPP